MFAKKTSHYVAIWYRQPNGTSEDFQLFRDQLDNIRNQHKGNKLPSVHVLGDFNFKDIDWPDRLNKSGAALSQSKGKILKDIMNDHGLEQLVHFPIRGHSDTRSVQVKFDLITSFIIDSADKHVPSKTSRSVSSVPWINPEIRRKIRRKNKTHTKASKTGSSKLRSKFETLRNQG